jgi:hypothetical protein
VNGIVKQFDPSRWGLITSDEDGKDYYFTQKSIIPDVGSYGSRAVYRNDLVIFDPLYETTGQIQVQKGKQVAINVKALNREPPAEIDPEYYEICTIKSVTDKGGVLIRPPGDTIWFHPLSVITLGPIEPGRRVLARFMNHQGRWNAHKVEIILEEGEQVSVSK